MTKKKILFSLIFLLLAACCLFSFLAYLRYLPLTYTPSEYRETSDSLNNPYSGFYHIYGYTLSEEADALSSVPETIQKELDSDTRLIMLQVNLKNYREKDLSSSALLQLDELLSAFSAINKHMILRFLYDWNGEAALTEPEDLSIIRSHIKQTAEIYNRYADHIYLLQGLFTGNYGEMNNSRYQSAEDITTLARDLADAADPSIFLAVRTPLQWRTITGFTDPLLFLNDTDGPFSSRLGLYNDGMLGSDTDTGTYADGTRASEISFQEALCDFIPNGGEVIISNPHNDSAAALRDLKSMHISYLNADYDMAVLEKWKTTTYHGTDSFSGHSYYDYIGAHLGYRYILRSSELTFSPFKDQEAKISLSLENTGFSGSCRPFDFTATLVNSATGERSAIIIPPDTNSRSLKSSETNDIILSLPVRDFEKGTYRLYFSMIDTSSGETIRFANDLLLSDYGYPIGTLTIGK